MKTFRFLLALLFASTLVGTAAVYAGDTCSDKSCCDSGKKDEKKPEKKS